MGGLYSSVPLLNRVYGAEAGILARSADGRQSASLCKKSLSSRPESYHLQRIALGPEFASLTTQPTARRTGIERPLACQAARNGRYYSVYSNRMAGG
jgi:hypothetical protein